MLPPNYNYEITKTVLKILQAKHELKKKEELKSYKVSLQFPEGLLLHSTLIADIVVTFCSETEQ